MLDRIIQHAVISAAENGPFSVRITWNGQSQLLHGMAGLAGVSCLICESCF
jgi:hypothetical protein